MSGNSLTRRPQYGEHDQVTALTVSGLTYHFGAKTALNDVSFSIPEGRFCALLGPNGAGKSTLFSLLTGLLVSKAGTITLNGHDMRRSPRSALADLGVVFQQTTLDLDLTVTQNLTYFAALHGISGRAAAKRIDDVLDRMSMRERAHEKTRALNGGHKRRVEIARALLHQPKVMLLDEPTVGLDAPARTAITDHVHSLCGNGDLTVLWATHLTDEVRMSDDLIILDRGTVLRHDLAGQIAGTRPLNGVFLDMIGASS